MNTYRIEHRIKTLSILWEPFEFGGFTFEPWQFDNVTALCGDAWLARKEIDAPDVNSAFRTFRQEFLPLVDRIGFVSQCFVDAVLEPFVILKQNDNAERVFFFRYAWERSGGHLYFDDDEKAALEALEGFEEEGDFFGLLRESTNASTFRTRIMLLISALEALAGEDASSSSRQKMTDKNKIRRILNNDALYEELFAYGSGLRNRLMHGARVDLAPGEKDKFDHAPETYAAIVQYFTDEYGIQLSTGVKNPQRTRGGSYIQFSSWLVPQSSNQLIDLRNLQNEFHEDREKFSKQFTIPDSAVDDY